MLRTCFGHPLPSYSWLCMTIAKAAKAAMPRPDLANGPPAPNPALARHEHQEGWVEIWKVKNTVNHLSLSFAIARNCSNARDWKRWRNQLSDSPVWNQSRDRVQRGLVWLGSWGQQMVMNQPLPRLRRRGLKGQGWHRYSWYLYQHWP